MSVNKVLEADAGLRGAGIARLSAARADPFGAALGLLRRWEVTVR